MLREIYGKHSKYVTYILLSLILLVYPTAIWAAQIKCPTPPAQLDRNIVVEIKGDMGRILKSIGINIDAKFSSIAENLFEKYPNSDKLIISQMLVSISCQFLSNASELSDEEKFKKLDKMNEQVLSLFRKSFLPPKIVPTLVKGKSPLLIGNNIEYFVFKNIGGKISYFEFEIISESVLHYPSGLNCAGYHKDGRAHMPVYRYFNDVPISPHKGNRLKNLAIYGEFWQGNQSGHIDAVAEHFSENRDCFYINTYVYLKMIYDDSNGRTRKQFYKLYISDREIFSWKEISEVNENEYMRAKAYKEEFEKSVPWRGQSGTFICELESRGLRAGTNPQYKC